ncbi:MAG: type I-B CRISPR-associated endonuclease Cas1b [Flavobacteriaceae bacterium]|nr:type I-B CRISPR-associated endonuclease Cas1b [Flavobacteriaceae bacterium]
MKTSYYIFSPGRLSRKDNSIFFSRIDQETKEEKQRFLPIENTKNLYCFGHLDINSELLTFLGKKGVSFHFFDFYEHYSGSFLPPKSILSGDCVIKQSAFYQDYLQRLWLAKRFVMGATKNMYKNLKYYLRRGKDIAESIAKIETLYPKIKTLNRVQELLGIEGNIRAVYYSSFNAILNDFSLEKRIKHPPKDEINSLISFLNMLCYTLCLDMLYQTPMNTTIGYLHEPSDRRHSLALDIAEVFKPVLVDRLIFTLINKKMIQKSDFQTLGDRIIIKNQAKKKIVKSWDEKLKETFYHRDIQKQISYRTLVLKECHKLYKHIQKEVPYRPFEIWW